MAMTRRLTDEDTEKLREQVEREGTSMHEVVASAVRDRVANSEHIVARDRAVARSVDNHREALKRLADL